ncbi:MAG: acyloxyacyl hydrolase [Candidatus Omnitrophica bacterium]|nr:acyloxyacyl hydrolase [Candidatus Omnitrophota bacterium]
MKKILIVLLSAIISFSMLGSALADEAKKSKCLEAIEFLTGFIWGGKLQAQKNYRQVPFIAAFDFNLKPLTEKIKFNPRSLLQFQIEPSVSYITSPHSNVELGTMFFFKAGILPQTSKFQPYVKAGVGMLYMTLHTREQSTQFNFQEQGGVGFHYFFRKNLAFTLEGRFRHLSNAGIGSRNHGINTIHALAGLTYQF